MAGDLRASVVIDYQNVHLTGHELFDTTRYEPRHTTVIDPLHFAQQLIHTRNDAQKPGHDKAVLSRVLVFRGQPSPEHDPLGYARNQAQKAHWERDARVRVTLRPLKYRYQRAKDGRPATDAAGRKLLAGPPQEKGIDVLCALAAVREAQDPDVDLVIVASSDSDLAPALDEVRRLGSAKVETVCWYDQATRAGQQLRPTDPGKPVWNTRLDEAAFHAARDRTDYGRR